MNQTYVIGDIHGGYKALIQVLQLAKFDYETDKLISLGDVCDGWAETAEAIEELLKIKNLVYIKGNHDEWAWKFLTDAPGFMKMSGQGAAWLHHGGRGTIASYEKNPHLKEKHIKFLNDAKLYYLDSENRLFVHGGFNEKYPINNQPGYHGELIYYWDREFWEKMYTGRNAGKEYKEVYLGHTPTLNFKNSPKDDNKKPLNRLNVWNMDTGACFTGRLSMMNIDTKELFQSDEVMKLYPNEFGRNSSVYQSIMKK